MPASRPAPCPPLSLANRVCSLEDRGDPFDAYETLGAETKTALLRLLPDNWSFANKRILDFGCGAGRTLRHFLAEAEHGEVWGADIDEASIAWLSANLSPPLRTIRNEPDPPLGLESGSFELIWALSVFTHLTDNSLAWLLELHRLLAPGGLLIATYMGRFNGEVFTHERWDEDRIGMNVLRRDQGWDAGGPMVLMSDWWVREHWGKAYTIEATEPEMHGQTWVLLKKREVELTVESLAAPSEDPREYAALQHNLRQVERDGQLALALLRQHYESHIQQHYENSFSWRITRPLRKASAFMQSRR